MAAKQKGQSRSCTRNVRHSLVKVEQNKRKAIFRNPDQNEYQVSEVDGCLIEDGPRCDCLVTELGNVSILIELKGGDVDHACEHLHAAAESEVIKPLLALRLGFLVICSKYPRFDTYVMRAKRDFARRYKAGFKVVCNHGEFDIERVADIED